MNPSPPLTPAHYSYSWALGVVKKAMEKHARVATFWCEFHGLTDRQLAKLIAEGRPEWPQLRRMLQIFDNWLKHSRLQQTERKWFRVMLYPGGVQICTGLREYLTKRISAIE